MIWIIASIPFWIIAAFSLVIGVFGFIAAFTSAVPSGKPFEKAIIGSATLALIAGLSGVIAAKICS